jgi:hypothetical protein
MPTVGDDGSGPGEGILSVLLTIPPQVAESAPHLAGMPTYVLAVAYDPRSARLMVDEDEAHGQAVSRDSLRAATDVTAEFTPGVATPD